MVLVLDSSGSIGPDDWEVTLQFARQVVEGLRMKAKENLASAVTWVKRADTKHNNLQGNIEDNNHKTLTGIKQPEKVSSV